MTGQLLVAFWEKFWAIFTSSSKKEGGSISGNMKSLNYKLSPISSGDLEVPLLLTFSCPEEWFEIRWKISLMISPHDFTGIIHNDNSSNESDFKMDLELIEKENHKEKDEASAPVVDGEVTSKLLCQDSVYC